MKKFYSFLIMLITSVASFATDYVSNGTVWTDMGGTKKYSSSCTITLTPNGNNYDIKAEFDANFYSTYACVVTATNVPYTNGKLEPASGDITVDFGNGAYGTSNPTLSISIGDNTSMSASFKVASIATINALMTDGTKLELPSSPDPGPDPTPEPTKEYKYVVRTNIAGGGVIYKDVEYQKDARIKPEAEITTEELTAIEVEGYHKGTISIADTIISVKYTMPLFKSDGTAYKLKYNNQYLDLTNTMAGGFGQNACLSAEGSPLYFFENEDGSFYINNKADSTGHFLGSYGWDASVEEGTKAAWTFEVSSTGTSYFLHGPDGYLKSNALKNCPLYSNASNTTSGEAKAFTIEELSSPTDITRLNGSNGSNDLNGKFVQNGGIVIVKDNRRYRMNGTKE